MLQGFKTLMRVLQVQENDPDYLEPQSFKTHAWEWGKLFLEIVILSDRSWNKKTNKKKWGLTAKGKWFGTHWCLYNK